MADRANIRIVVDNTDRLLDLTEEEIISALTEIGETAVQYATAEVDAKVYSQPPPQNYRRTGNLRQYITKQLAEKGGTHEVQVGDAMEYAPFVELGTSRGLRPRPFIRPSLEDHISEWKEIIEGKLSDIDL